jgi:hypothetical protein
MDGTVRKKYSRAANTQRQAVSRRDEQNPKVIEGFLAI